MSAKHTPGPWCADRDFVYPALPVTAVNRFYAIVHGAHTGADELAANARLMAAAPELLALLYDVIYDKKYEPGTPWNDAARAVIAKVEG